MRCLVNLEEAWKRGWTKRKAGAFVPQHANHDKESERGLYERGSSVQVDVMTKRPLPNDRLGCPRLLDDGPSFQEKRMFFCSQ
jgi:hypothetical protein